jgi:hypothetical protein
MHDTQDRVRRVRREGLERLVVTGLGKAEMTKDGDTLPPTCNLEILIYFDILGFQGLFLRANKAIFQSALRSQPTQESAITAHWVQDKTSEVERSRFQRFNWTTFNQLGIGTQ